ncbi:hypothetical protein XSR1_50101 [Xenorhabdus szentirmaii DSM 16338]|uniref:Transposase IS4-like domain-containing protein n=1 Tax=Xenorhabdus szentirmaii DSM 16338 TaxID=1427518 RepID=W1J1V0_9GAMM|nr:transposase [Xenorhabdus szentirmaii DSM 16338]CDL84699.1 hypothetical protein XSR1_50101 [Xenorhabdus szentirmaii DSM 16338]
MVGNHLAGGVAGIRGNLNIANISYDFSVGTSFSKPQGFKTNHSNVNFSACRNKKTGHNPTGRGKQGVKRSLLTVGNGLPLAVVVAPANTHDIKLVIETLAHLETGRPGQALLLHLDKAYEAEWLEK